MKPVAAPAATERADGDATTIGHAFSLGMLSSALVAVLAIVRAKVVAVVLGPVGVGITAEVIQIATLSATPASLAAGPALVSAVAQADASEEKRQAAQRAYDSALTFALASASLAVPLAVLVAWLTLPDNWTVVTWHVEALAAAAIAVTMCTAVVSRVLVARREISRHTYVTIGTSLLTVAAVAAGTYFFGLYGFFASMLLGAVLGVPIWVASLATSRAPIHTRPRLRADRAYLREAVALGGSGLVGVIAAQAALYAVRTTLGRLEGPAANGLFQACWAIDAVYLQAALQSLGNAIFPRYAAARTHDDLRTQIEQAALFMLRYLPPLLLVAIALRSWVLPLLYTREFLPAAQLLGLILAADTAKIVSWSQDGALLYRGYGARYAVLQLVGWSTFAVATLAFVPRLGLLGVGYAYVLMYAVHVAVSAVTLSRTLGLPVARGTLLKTYAALAIALACSAIADAGALFTLVSLAAAAVWAWQSGAFADALRALTSRYRRS